MNEFLNPAAANQAANPVATIHGEPLMEMPRDLYIPPDALEVFLDTFQGPLDLPDECFSGQLACQVFGHRPAQTGIAHNQVLQAPTQQVGQQSQTRGFDFGKLGHAAILFQSAAGIRRVASAAQTFGPSQYPWNSISFFFTSPSS